MPSSCYEAQQPTAPPISLLLLLLLLLECHQTNLQDEKFLASCQIAPSTLTSLTCLALDFLRFNSSQLFGVWQVTNLIPGQGVWFFLSFYLKADAQCLLLAQQLDWLFCCFFWFFFHDDTTSFFCLHILEPLPFRLTDKNGSCWPISVNK